MNSEFRIKRITSSRSKDLTKALDIYLHTTDEGAITPTTQIRDHIDNNYNDERKLFFYIFYANGIVSGYAEYAYLPETETLFIDYLCTSPRNHTYFYVFYHMLFDEISEILRKKELYLKYIAVELSLKKDSENKYIDVDSNYFRELLSIESFKILKAPYYQLYCSTENKFECVEYNLAIKPLFNGLYSGTTLDKSLFISLVTDVYRKHYVAWYEKYMSPEYVSKEFESLIIRIKDEYTDVMIDDVSAVNCILLQHGLCKQISIESVTLRKKKKKIIIRVVTISMSIFFAGLTAILCYKEYDGSVTTTACSFLTILMSVISLVQLLRDRFL